VRVVIVGAGTVGYDLAMQLQKGPHDVSIIDLNADRCEVITEKMDILVIHGNGCSPHLLEEAGILEADSLIAVTSSDEANILACGLAQQYGVDKRIARIRSSEFVGRSSHVDIHALGVTHVIDPEQVVVRIISQIAMIPNAIEVFSYHEGEILIARHILHEGMSFVGKTVIEALAQGEHSNLLAVALKRGGKAWIPNGDDTLEVGDDMTTAFPRRALHSYLELFELNQEQVEKAVVAGNSLMAVQLCTALKKWVNDVTLVDRDAVHGLSAAEALDGVDVIHGDPTERDVLGEVNVAGADIYVGAGDETTHNVMGALLARSEGAGEVFAISYEPRSNRLFRELGVQQVISPRRAMAQTIMDILEHGHGVVELQLRDMELESVELCAEHGSHILRGPLKEVWSHFRGQAIVGAIIRDGMSFVPNGETWLKEDDEAIVVTHPDALKKLRQFFEGDDS